MSASLGDGRTFFVTPYGYSRSGAFMQSIAGKGPGMVFTSVDGALAACTSGRGDRVFLLPGTHEIGSEVYINASDVTLMGSGSNRTFISAPNGEKGSNLIRVAANGCTIQDICFKPIMSDESTAANGYRFDECSNFGINIVGAQHTTIKNCSFIDAGSDDDGYTSGVNIETGSKYVLIEDCDFLYLYREAINLHCQGSGISTVTIRRCHLKGKKGAITAHDGLTSAASSGTVESLNIYDCVLYDSDSGGQVLLALDQTDGGPSAYQGCSIMNCHIGLAENASGDLDLNSSFALAGLVTKEGLSTGAPD